MNTPLNNKSPVRGVPNQFPSPQRMHFGSPQGDRKLEYGSSRALGSPCRAPSPYAAAAFGPTGARSPSSDAVNKQNLINIDKLRQPIGNGNTPHNPQRTPSPLLGIDNLPRSKNWVGSYITVVKQIGKGSFGEAFLATVNHDGGKNLITSSPVGTAGGMRRSTSPLSNLPPPPRSVSPPLSAGAFSHTKHKGGSPAPQSPVSHFPHTIVIKVTPDQRNFRYALKEIELLRKIRHPHICQYVDSWREIGGRSEFEGKMCFAMEYCDSGDLEKFIDTYKNRYFRQIPPEVVSVLSLQLLSAVASCHANKIVHRDIKPQNIFLTRRELTTVGDIGNTPPASEAQTRRTRTVIALGDFGISKDLSYTMEASSSVVGTPYYMCPEIVSKQPYTNTSDVWSVGVVLYEMMMLERPFELSRNVDRRYQMGLLYDDICRSDPVELLKRKCAGIYDSWLINVTAACLRKNPEERPSAMELLTNFSPAVDQLLVRHKIPVPKVSSNRAATQKQLEKEKQQLGRDSPPPFPLTPTSNGSPKRLQQSAAISPLSEKASPPANKFESEERGQHSQQGYGSHQQLPSPTPMRNASPRQGDYTLQPATSSPSPLDKKDMRTRQAAAQLTSASKSSSSSSPNKRDPTPTHINKDVRVLSAARDFSSGDVLRPANAPKLLSPSRGLTPTCVTPPSPTRDCSVLPQRDLTSPLSPQQRTESRQRRSPSVPSNPSPQPQREGGLGQPIPLSSAAVSPLLVNRPPINIDVVRSSPIRKAPPSPQAKALLRFQQEQQIQHQEQQQQQLNSEKTNSAHQSPSSRKDGVDAPLLSQSPSRVVSAAMDVLDDLKRRRAAREEELTRMRQEQDNRLASVVAEVRAGREREKERALHAMREEAAAAAQARAMQKNIGSNININKKEEPTKAAIGGTSDNKTRGVTPTDEVVNKSPTTRSSQKDLPDAHQPRARSPLSLSPPPSINSVAALRAEHTAAAGDLHAPHTFPLSGSDSDLLAAGKALFGGQINASDGSCSRCSSPPSSPPRPPTSPLRAAPSGPPSTDPSKPTPLAAQLQLQKTPPLIRSESGPSSVRTSPTGPTTRNAPVVDDDCPLTKAKAITPFVVNADRYMHAAPCDQSSNPPISSPQLATTTCPPSPCETSALSPTRPSSPPLPPIPLSPPPTPTTKYQKKGCMGPFALHEETSQNVLGKDGSDAAGTAISKIAFSETSASSIQNTSSERKGAMTKPPKSKSIGVGGATCTTAATTTTPTTVAVAAVPRESSSNSAIPTRNAADALTLPSSFAATALCAVDSSVGVDFHATNAALDVARVLDRHARALVGNPLHILMPPTAATDTSLFQLSNATFPFSSSSSALSPHGSSTTPHASSTGTLPPSSTTMLSAASQAERSSTAPSSSTLLSHVMTYSTPSASSSSSSIHHKYTSPHASANETLLIKGLGGDVEAFLIVKLLSLTTPKTLLRGGEGGSGGGGGPTGVAKREGSDEKSDLDNDNDGGSGDHQAVADGDCLSSLTSHSFSSSLSLSFDVNTNSSITNSTKMDSDDAEETHAGETKAINAKNGSFGKKRIDTASLPPTTTSLTISQYEAFIKFRAATVIEALRKADEQFIHKIVPSAASMVARHSRRRRRRSIRKTSQKGVLHNNKQTTTDNGSSNDVKNNKMRAASSSSASARHTDPTVDDTTTSFSSYPKYHKYKGDNRCGTEERKPVNAPFGGGCTQNQTSEEIPRGTDKNTTVTLSSMSKKTTTTTIPEQNTTSPHRLHQCPLHVQQGPSTYNTSTLPSRPTLLFSSTNVDAFSDGNGKKKKPLLKAIGAFLSDTRLSGRRGDLSSAHRISPQRGNTARGLSEEEEDSSALPPLPSGGSLG